MTIFLVLGLFAGLYMLWLLFGLAVYALPLYAGFSLAFWMHAAGYGYAASIFGGFVAAIATFILGQVLFAIVRSPIIRFSIALIFVIPAGTAGFHAVYGIAGLAIEPGALLSALSWLGAFVIGATAWIRLVSFDLGAPAAPQARLSDVPVN